MRSLTALWIGTVSGTISAWAFAYIHGIFISNIWFSLPALLIAGAICGLCLGWTYGLLFETPSLRSWLEYNACFVVMFLLLGVTSVVVYQPVTTLAAVMASDALPDALILQALPVTVTAMLAIAAVMGKRYARTWTHYFAILITSAILVLLLGLNVSAIGLIAIPHSSAYLLLELAGLILALNGVFAVVFAGLGWRLLFHNQGHSLRSANEQRLG